MKPIVINGDEFVERFGIPDITYAVKLTAIKNQFKEQGIPVMRNQEIRLFKYKDRYFAVKHNKDFTLLHHNTTLFIVEMPVDYLPPRKLRKFFA